MSGIVVILLTLLVSALLHIVCSVLMLRCFRVSARRVGLGLGPRVYVHRRERSLLILHLLLPLGSYVKAATCEVYRLGRFGFSLLSLVSPCLVNLLVAAVLLGPSAAVHTAQHGVTTFFTGAVRPMTVGQDAWRTMYDAANQQPIMQTAGVVFALVGIINSIPLFPLPGFQILATPFRNPTKQAFAGAWLVPMYGSLLVVFAAWLSWLFAMGVAVFG